MTTIVLLSILGLERFNIDFAGVVTQGSVPVTLEETTNEECMIVEIGARSLLEAIRIVVAIGQGPGAGGAGGIADAGMASASYSWRVKSVRKKNNLVATDLIFTYKSVAENFVVRKKFNVSPRDVKTLHLPHRVKVKAYCGPCTSGEKALAQAPLVLHGER